MEEFINKGRKRYISGEFNLDLIYLTPRIILFGTPRSYDEFESLKALLSSKHSGNYKVINCCSHAEVEGRIFNPDEFENLDEFFISPHTSGKYNILSSVLFFLFYFYIFIFILLF